MTAPRNYAHGRFLIYGLADPMSDEVRYIGKSCSGLKRPKAHVARAARSANTHAARWVRQVLARGQRPTVRVLDVADCAADLEAIERGWIAQARECGWRLTNITAGGTGGRGGWNKGLKHRPETVEKIRAATQANGYRHSPEIRALISKSKLGRKKIDGRMVRVQPWAF